MRALMSQTKLPDSSNPLSDIVGAVQLEVFLCLLIFHAPLIKSTLIFSVSPIYSQFKIKLLWLGQIS